MLQKLFHWRTWHRPHLTFRHVWSACIALAALVLLGELLVLLHLWSQRDVWAGTVHGFGAGLILEKIIFAEVSAGGA